MRDKVCEALRFAIDHYDNAGIGYDGNYFLPPMEMLSLLNGMGMAERNLDLLIAGILYNIVEDTDAAMDMICDKFGPAVFQMVGEHLAYPKPKGGKPERLKEAIAGVDGLKASYPEIRILALCDTVVKQRQLKRDLTVRGDETWEKQAVPKEVLCEYFSRVQDALYDLQFDEMTAPAYWEMVDTFKDLFVTFYYDQENQRMFQFCADGENYVIGRDDLQAKPWKGVIPENAVVVNRKFAERIEDNWGELEGLKNQAVGLSFEEYFVAVKRHLREFFKDTSEEDLDRLMIANLDYVVQRYNEDAARLNNGETTVDMFLAEGPSMTADGLERLVERPD